MTKIPYQHDSGRSKQTGTIDTDFLVVDAKGRFYLKDTSSAEAKIIPLNAEQKKGLIDNFGSSVVNQVIAAMEAFE